MADLDQTQSGEPVYIIGADSAGVEQTPVQSTSAGALHSNLRDSAGNEVKVRQLSDPIVAADYGIISNTIIHGVTTGGGGGYVDVKVNPSGALVTDATGSAVSVTNFPATQAVTQSGSWTFNASVAFDQKEKDAFDRLITVTPLQIKSFDARITKHLDNFDEAVVGSGTSTLNTTTATVDLAVTTGSTDSVIRQSYESFKYVRGNTQAGLFSLNLNGGAKANNMRMFGLGDSENGAFIGIDGTGFFVMRRSKTSGSVVDTKTYQTSFNKDKMDGTGTSGITLDFTAQNLFSISYSWLGTNAIIYSVTIGGIRHIMHVDSVGNSLSTAWCQSGQLPLYFQNTNTGTTASSTTFKTSCAAVFSYGSSKGFEEYVSVSSVVTPITLSTTEKVVAGIRLRTGLKYVSIEPADYEIIPQAGNGFAYYKVIFRPTLTGATWTNYGEISQALTNNPTYTGGIIIQEGYLNLAAAGRLAVNIPATLETTLGYSINGTPDSLIVVVRTDAGTGGIYFAGSWKEIF